MFDTILLPVDLSDLPQTRPARLIEVAVETARSAGATVHLQTIVPDFGMSIVGSFFPPDFEQTVLAQAATQLEPLAERLRADGVTVGTHVGCGPIYDQILRHADRLGCDAIVIGAHRPEPTDYLLGPNAARVVRHAHQSVIVVRDR